MLCHNLKFGFNLICKLLYSTVAIVYVMDQTLLKVHFPIWCITSEAQLNIRHT